MCIRWEDLIVCIKFGIFKFWLFFSLRVLVLYVIFWRNDGLDKKLRKWLILIVFKWYLVIFGGLMGCSGLVWKVCFFGLFGD